MNYTIKKPSLQGANPLNYKRTHPSQCKKNSRCKNIRLCSHCRLQWQKREMNKKLSHITDTTLSRFKYKQYVTITPNTFTNDLDLYNTRINDLSKYLTNSGKRRTKAHPLSKSDYIVFKEITKTNGVYLPHLHIIYLSNTPFNIFNDNLETFDIHVEDIKIIQDEKYKQYHDYINPLTNTLKNIFMYSSKFDKDRANLESSYSISYNKSDIKVSKLFKPNTFKSHTLHPMNIATRKKIQAKGREALLSARSAHTSYKKAHPKAKGLTIHKHALKTARKIQSIKANTMKLLKQQDSKLKRCNRPNFRTKTAYTLT